MLGRKRRNMYRFETYDRLTLPRLWCKETKSCTQQKEKQDALKARELAITRERKRREMRWAKLANVRGDNNGPARRFSNSTAKSSEKDARQIFEDWKTEQKTMASMLLWSHRPIKRSLVDFETLTPSAEVLNELGITTMDMHSESKGSPSRSNTLAALSQFRLEMQKDSIEIFKYLHSFCLGEGKTQASFDGVLTILKVQYGWVLAFMPTVVSV